MHLRKIIPYCFVVLVLTASITQTASAADGSQCMMVVTYSEMASIQFKKAFKAKSIEDARKFLKKGMEHIKEAAAYCPQCDCNLAETYALEAFAIAKKNEDTTDIELINKQAKKSMDLSIDAMAAAQKCNE